MVLPRVAETAEVVDIENTGDVDAPEPAQRARECRPRRTPRRLGERKN
jgi:hypothetical protein